MPLIQRVLRCGVLLAAAAVVSAHLSLQVAPLTSEDALVAPRVSASASASDTDACAPLLGTFPGWDSHAQQQRWYAARLIRDTPSCAAAAPRDGGGSQGTPGATASAPVYGDELYFWVSQVAIEEEEPGACPWHERLNASLGGLHEADAYGLLEASSGSGPALVLQRRALSSGGSGGAFKTDILAALADEGITHVPRIVALTHTYAVLALPRIPSGHHASAHIDRFLPFDSHVARIVLARSTAAPAHAAAAAAPKPEPWFPRVEYDPVVARVLNDSELATPRFEAVVKTLSGEDQRDALARGFTGWQTRHSGTWGARHAAVWIKDEMESSLASLPGAACELWSYSEYYAPNVVCTIPPAAPAAPAAAAEAGGHDGEVVVSAHYDSRGTFGELAAPGADDDGSGTAALLVLARTLGNYGVRFRRPVRLVLFSGEEQGLVGSAAYVAWLAATQTQVHVAFQLDMLAYRVPGEPRQIAFPDKLATAAVTALVGAVAQTYVPELVRGLTPACCSDHQSFWDAGFPASWAFERAGPIRDPFYHDSRDVAGRAGFDLVQLQLITKVVLATVLTRGDFFV